MTPFKTSEHLNKKVYETLIIIKASYKQGDLNLLDINNNRFSLSFSWNEKRLALTEFGKQIRVITPVETYVNCADACEEQFGTGFYIQLDLEGDVNTNILAVEVDSYKDAPSSDTDEDVDDNIREKLKNFHVEESKMVEIVKELLNKLSFVSIF